MASRPTRKQEHRTTAGGTPAHDGDLKSPSLNTSAWNVESLAPLRQHPSGHPGLQAEVVEHLVARPSLLGRHLRQEHRGAAVLLQQDAVAADDDRRGPGDLLEGREDRDLDLEVLQLVRP